MLFLCVPCTLLQFNHSYNGVKYVTLKRPMADANNSLLHQALGSTQPLTEMSTKNFPDGKGRPARKANNFTANCVSRLCRNYGSLDVSQPYGPPQRVKGIAFFLSGAG
jgi:hypothetical protein